MNAIDLRYSELGYFWQVQNGRAVTVREKRQLDGREGFIVFGDLDALTRTGCYGLGEPASLQLASEVCGEFLTLAEGEPLRRFCNSFLPPTGPW
jgi:hypothetical protein